MFIYVKYKLGDAGPMSAVSMEPESRGASMVCEASTEGDLMVNPNCPVRMMLDYIQLKCDLSPDTKFDLADAEGHLLNLFKMPSWHYALDLFVLRDTYYIIITVEDDKKQVEVYPYLHLGNKLYSDLKIRVRKNLASLNENTNSKLSKSKLGPKITFTKK